MSKTPEAAPVQAFRGFFTLRRQKIPPVHFLYSLIGCHPYGRKYVELVL